MIPFSTWVWTSPFTSQLNEPVQGYLCLPLKSPLSSLISHLRFVIYSPCPRIVAPSQAGGSERDVASEEYLIYSSKDQIKRFSDSFSIIFTISLANSLRIHWNATPILTFYCLQTSSNRQIETSRPCEPWITQDSNPNSKVDIFKVFT